MVKKFLKLQLHWQIFIALALAVVLGVVATPETRLFDISLVSALDFLGALFLNALKMLIVPLIVSAIVTGMMEINPRMLGRLGTKTLLYYMVTSTVAIIIGLAVVNLLQPGVVDGEPALDLLGLPADAGDILSNVEGRGAGDISDVFLRMIPPNIIAAAAQGQMLGLIFFSLLFGYFVTQLKEPYGSSQKNFWQGLLNIMMGMTDLIMRFSPLGVFALVGKVVLTSGVDAFRPLAVFFIAVLIALAIHTFIFLPLVLKFVARVKPLLHFKAMTPALLTAFSTSSSAAALPVTMESVEKGSGVSNQISGFTLPLGSTVNMDGTALYECVAAMFIAQAYGLQLDVATQFTIVMVALLTSVGVAGIPSASLVAIAIILGAIGLPLEAIGLILVVDRVLDMCRTAVNVFSDSCAAVVIARLEGEKTKLV